ncbi:MAG: hypothetical protein K5898_03695 [Ruminococcus sp.]|uniref:hypothetical protein n=1 Tax=Ruminococcus sp. TaxID=41978 RepID=UPI0025E80DA7|nr:hypothetical protein [Ruminococcus sp.]MCR4794271.1 hypothetical protein [Ruminococcus sp.]
MINGEKYLLRVPSAYQEVEYLQNSGTQYIDTGLIGTDLYGCEIEITMSNESDVTTQYNFNGAYKSGFATQLGLVATSATECRASMNFGFIDAASMPGLSNHQFHTLYLSDGLQKVDNVRIGTSSYGTASSLRFFLFAREQETTPVINYCVAMKLKAFSVKKNGQYIRNMIPVRRISDSVLGLYDTANNVFYTNQGTGTFTAGADVSPWHDTPIPTRKLHNATDVITSLPVDLYTDGQTIGANLFDYKTVYSSYINANGDIAANASNIKAWNNFTSNDVGKTLTISIYVKNISASYVRVQGYIDGNYITGNNINAGTSGYSVITVTPTSTNDTWRIIYGDDTYVEINQVMVEQGSTRTTYVPYAPTIIKGNMSQTGTPTPTTPIYPSECGDTTVNLFDGSLEQGTTSYGDPIPANNRVRSGIFYLGAGTFTFSCANSEDYQIGLDYHSSDGAYVSGTGWLTNKTFDLTNSTPQIRLKIKKSNDANFTPQDVENAMINTGSTALPFQPHGYKIDIKSGNTTTPVYLGQVQTTRQIKKLVFTGQENNWAYSAEYTRFTTIIPNAYNTGVRTDETPCTHYVSIHDGRAIENVPNNSVYTAPSAGNVYLSIKDTAYTSLDAWKTYLQQQYAAGTPVCVWYILATETTGVVNEPLRKIGDYADSVSVTGIPTTAGGIEFDVDTILKPSEVSLTYHGWHDISPEQYENGAWN